MKQVYSSTIADDEILKACTPHPNGTYDVVPVFLADGSIRFDWGNSLLQMLDPKVQNLKDLVGKRIHMKELSQELKWALLQLPHATFQESAIV